MIYWYCPNLHDNDDINSPTQHWSFIFLYFVCKTMTHFPHCIKDIPHGPHSKSFQRESSDIINTHHTYSFRFSCKNFVKLWASGEGKLLSEVFNFCTCSLILLFRWIQKRFFYYYKFFYAKVVSFFVVVSSQHRLLKWSDLLKW